MVDHIPADPAAPTASTVQVRLSARVLVGVPVRAPVKPIRMQKCIPGNGSGIGKRIRVCP